MIVAILKTSPLFSSFPTEALEELVQKAMQVTVPAAGYIIRAGESNDSLWLVLEGDVVIRDSLPGGLELNLVRLKVGDLCGEISFADSLPASASVVALSTAKLLRFPFREMKEFFSDRPACHVAFLEQLVAICARRLRHANEEVRKGFLASLELH